MSTTPETIPPVAPSTDKPVQPQTAMAVRQRTDTIDRYGYEPESRAEAWNAGGGDAGSHPRPGAWFHYHAVAPAPVCR